jgi:GTP-binding protein EngB required for normal cell division
VYTPAMNEFTEKLQIYLSKKLESKLMQTRTDLKKENVLIDLNKKEKKIKNEMFSYLLDDIEIMYFDAALRNFTNQHLGET